MLVLASNIATGLLHGLVPASALLGQLLSHFGMPARPWGLVRAQATLALASTEALLQRVPMFADDRPLLESVAVLLKPAYALAGAGLPALFDGILVLGVQSNSIHGGS